MSGSRALRRSVLRPKAHFGLTEQERHRRASLGLKYGQLWSVCRAGSATIACFGERVEARMT